MGTTYYQSVGRRKRAVARIFLKNGTGKLIVNERPIEEYFKRMVYIQEILKPFKLTNTEGKYDAIINVRGGGTTGQAEAIRHGIARALLKINPDFKPILKKNGLLTRDPREVERKKYGQPKARKKFQFSKR